MKTNKFMVSVVILLFCLMCWNVYGQKQVSPKVTWEYMVRTERTLTAQHPDLNVLGAEGWELTTVTQRDQIMDDNLLDIERQFYFKRQK